MADALPFVTQLTAVDGRRAFVTLPNDPELVDILARNGVDISVSEGDQQGNYVSLLGAHFVYDLLLPEPTLLMCRCGSHLGMHNDILWLLCAVR
jgi:hypothetical protein